MTQLLRFPNKARRPVAGARARVHFYDTESRIRKEISQFEVISHLLVAQRRKRPSNRGCSSWISDSLRGKPPIIKVSAMLIQRSRSSDGYAIPSVSLPPPPLPGFNAVYNPTPWSESSNRVTRRGSKVKGRMSYISACGVSSLPSAAPALGK